MSIRFNKLAINGGCVAFTFSHAPTNPKIEYPNIYSWYANHYEGQVRGSTYMYPATYENNIAANPLAKELASDLKLLDEALPSYLANDCQIEGIDLPPSLRHVSMDFQYKSTL